MAFASFRSISLASARHPDPIAIKPLAQLAGGPPPFGSAVRRTPAHIPAHVIHPRPFK
jgi:hypothetical protein